MYSILSFDCKFSLAVKNIIMQTKNTQRVRMCFVSNTGQVAYTTLASFTGLRRKEGLLSTACAYAKLLDIFSRKIS